MFNRMLPVWILRAWSVFFLLGVLTPALDAEEERTVRADSTSIDRLLAPVKSLENIKCKTPSGIQFESKGEGSWVLRGKLSNKRGTVVLLPGEGAWDISGFSYFRVDLVNSGPGLVWIRGRLDNPGAQDWANSTASQAFIMPGERATLGFPYPRSKEANDAPAIFDKQNGKPNGHRAHWKQFDPANVRACRLTIQSTSEDLSLEDITISMAQPYGAAANADLLKLPYLDVFGQVLRLDWPGKLKNDDELKFRLKEEEKVLASDPGPTAFNRYGGWADGPQLEETGFFRTEKLNGKWWLIDPDGYLFFSHGVNSVGFGQKTPIKGREALFEWLPAENDPLMKDVVEESKAHFMVANLVRTFGADWQEPAYDRLHRRMRYWGLNTLGAWSDKELSQDKKTPYTAILHAGGDWSALGHGISDPFSDAFKNNIRKGLRRIMPDAEDPWCVGVFIDNEVNWTELFVRKTFTRGPQQPARMAAIEWLKEKYGEVGGLNQAWGTEFASWEEIGELPRSETDALKEDVLSLKRLISGTYYKACRDAMREVLPNHLYLGSRMHKAPREVMEEAVKYVDVLSLNSYESLSGSKVPSWADVPCLDTEFHFAAPDRGGLGVGLMPVGDQVQRSRAYVAYVVAGLLHSKMVGTHWFAFTDQSAAGRPGENYQIGFVDVTDTPYSVMTDGCRALAERMYAIGSGEDGNLLSVLESLWTQ